MSENAAGNGVGKTSFFLELYSCTSFPEGGELQLAPLRPYSAATLFFQQHLFQHSVNLVPRRVPRPTEEIWQHF